VPLKECLETIGLTAARYHSWIKRQVKCLLPDQSTCPKLSPTKITSKETLAIKELVTTKEYTHFSINSLAMFARRQQMVFASATAWYRIVREFNLRRPGVRIYPPKPKIGIRALEPNQIWHVDVSVFRIMNGAKVYIQAIIDNASRYVLAWQVTQNYGGANTKALIEKALEAANRFSARVVVPNLFADDRRKCPWCEYLTDHNNRIPHYALGGAVPLEVFSGTWTQESQLLLAEAAATATLQRIEFNHTQKCGLCPA
jgi:hypothetical protein